MHAVIENTDLNFKQYWSELFANDPLQNPVYSQHLADTPQTPSIASPFVDRSFVVISENQPVFACSLTMHTDERGRKCLGYFGVEASTHINRQSMESASHNFHAKAVELLQHHINQLIDEIKPHFLDYLDPVSCGVMSPVTQVLLEKGARPIVQTAKIIDLTLSEHALMRNMRKSQRGLIHWGQRNLDIDIISGEKFGESQAASLVRIFEEARVAGETPASGLMRYAQLIHQGKAFMVQGAYAGEPVADALFLHTARTCHLVFGSQTPQAPDRPMMPALIWAAMQHGRQLGCANFEMGRLRQSDPADCERSRLLNSFGGDSQTRLKVCLVA